MTIRERLHAWIDTLPESEVVKVANSYGLNEDKEDIAETIALWKALAEPVEDKAEKAEFHDAIKRRPLFGDRDYPVSPD